ERRRTPHPRRGRGRRPHPPALGLRRPGARRAARHAQARHRSIRGILRRLRHRPGGTPRPLLRGDGRLRRDGGAPRHPLREPLRAPHRAHHRPRPHRLPPGQAGGRHFQARPRAGGVQQAPPDPGAAHGPGGQQHPRRAEAQGRRGGGRRHAPVHDHPRRPPPRGHDGDEPHARRLPRRPLHPAGIPRHHRRPARRAGGL
ncbi:MAG: GTP cyclohydrolase I type 1, partial [uncultured Acetobacteraceae bacterium]